MPFYIRNGMRLSGIRVCVLAGPDYEDLELHYPMIRLAEEGASVRVAGPSKGVYRGKHGLTVEADLSIGECRVGDFDILVIPGGWAPDRLRRIPEVVSFVRDFFLSGRIVASICHGPQILISARVLGKVRLTCTPAIKDDVINAGGIYEDSPVVVDGNLVTSRNPGDLPHFCRAIIELASGRMAQNVRSETA
ncbi:Putative cysteine protease YraA [archaeon HR01]|nr:Putative cysteine protease YraA [archaeon HR01]